MHTKFSSKVGGWGSSGPFPQLPVTHLKVIRPLCVLPSSAPLPLPRPPIPVYDGKPPGCPTKAHAGEGWGKEKTLIS